MPLMNSRSDQEALARQVCPESPAGDIQRPLVNLACSRLDGQHGLQLHNRKVGNQRARTHLLQDSVHVLRPDLLVVALRKCASVEKVARQISALAGVRLRPRTGSRESWKARA